MKTFILTAMAGANRAERAGLILLMAIVALAIVSSAIMMLYWYAADIKQHSKRNMLKAIFWIEDAADRLQKWSSEREDEADFTEISDWADYRKWKATQIPTWHDVLGSMLRESVK